MSQMNMNYTSNRTFFKPKRVLSYIGGAIAICGLPIFFLTGGSIVAALPFVAVGAVMLVVNRELNVKDSDVEEQIRTEEKRLEQDLVDRFYDVKRPFPKMMTTVIGDYVTTGEGLLMRKGSLGKTITSEYKLAVFGFKGDRLYVSEEAFSIVEDKAEAKIHEYPFLSCDRMEYGTVEGAAVPHSELSLYTVDGTCVLTVPAPTDYTTQKFVEDTCDIFKKHREDAAKNGADSSVEQGDS